MFSLKTLIPVLATAVLLVVPAEATTTYYAGASQEAAFNSALGTLSLVNSTIDFSLYNGFLGSALSNANGTGIDFLGFDDFVFNGPTDLSVASGKLKATAPGEVLKIVLPAAGLYALGFHISVVSGSANWYVALTPGGTPDVLTNASNSTVNYQFFGFVSDTPVAPSLYIRNAGGNPTLVIPDFKAYSASSISVSEVPEPQSMLLAGFGLVILGVIRRKIQRAG